MKYDRLIALIIEKEKVKGCFDCAMELGRERNDDDDNDDVCDYSVTMVMLEGKG